jgi:hypothetical protein
LLSPLIKLVGTFDWLGILFFKSCVHFVVEFKNENNTLMKICFAQIIGLGGI